MKRPRWADGSVAVALLNRGNATATVSTTTAQIGVTAAAGYTLFDVWTKASRNTTGAISAVVPAPGVVMYRVRAGTTTPTDSFSLRGAGSGRCLDLLGGPTTTVSRASSGTATAARPRSSPRCRASCGSTANAWTPRTTAPPTTPGSSCGPAAGRPGSDPRPD